MTKKNKLLYGIITLLVISNFTLMFFLINNQTKNNTGVNNSNQIESSSEKDTSKTESKSKYTRDECKKLFIGKTQNEILDILGKPYSNTEYGTTTRWFYSNISYDPVTNSVDDSIQIIFENGICHSLYF